MDKSFESITTPGLNVDFKNYVIEIVCTNLNPRLSPRFWKDPGYWKSKYVREIKGVSNLINLLKKNDIDIEIPINQKSIIEVIKTSKIKSLCAKKTLAFVIKKIIKTISEKESRSSGYKEDIIFNAKDNAKFIGPILKTKKSLLREIENG